MTKDFKIVSINRYPISEKNKYPQVVVEIMTNDGLMKGYANDGNWNKSWKVDDTVKADVTMKESKNGNKYFKLNCPPELKPKGYAGNGNLLPVLTSILNELVIVRNLIQEKKAPEQVDTVAELTGGEEPPAEPEIDVSDLPF